MMRFWTQWTPYNFSMFRIPSWWPASFYGVVILDDSGCSNSQLWKKTLISSDISPQFSDELLPPVSLWRISKLSPCQVPAQHSTSGRLWWLLCRCVGELDFHQYSAYWELFIWVASSHSFFLFPLCSCMFFVYQWKSLLPPLPGRCFAAMLTASPCIINLHKAPEGGRNRESTARLPP